MGQTYWYARDDDDATPSGPFHDVRTDVEVGENQRLRPIDESVLPADAEVAGTDGDVADDELGELSHEELKDVAEARGVAEDIDLRSSASIIEGLREAGADEQAKDGDGGE